MILYLSKRALDLAEEIIVRHLRSLVVNIIHSKMQFLHLLEIIVQLKSTRKLWIQAVLYVLRPPKLCTQQLSL